MRALVAGGAGFIGSALVDRLLAEGHAVDVVDDLSTGRLENLADARADRHAELRIHQVDLREPEVVDLLQRRSPEVVYQLAAVERDGAPEDALTTVVGTLRLLEGARRAGARKVVMLVDDQVYGGDVDPPFKESDAGAPLTAHGVAQLAAVEYLRLYRERWAVDFTVLAADDVCGPRRRSGIVVDAGRAMLAGASVVLRAPAAEARDVLFVDDVVDGLVRASDRAGGLLLNLGWGRGVSAANLGRTVADAIGVVDAVSYGDGVVRHVALDAARATLHLGWSPWTDLDEAVAATLRWLSTTVD